MRLTTFNTLIIVYLIILLIVDAHYGSAFVFTVMALWGQFVDDAEARYIEKEKREKAWKEMEKILKE